MGIKAEKSPCYLPGSSKALTTTTMQQNTNNKHLQTQPHIKQIYKKILLYIYASKVTRILIISSILTGLTVHKHDDINNWCYWSYW